MHTQAGEQVLDEALNHGSVQAQPESKLVVVEVRNVPLVCMPADY